MARDKLTFDIYQDHGCDLAPSCLACPFEVCKYEGGLEPHERRVLRTLKLTREVRALRSKGIEVKAIAARVNRSERSVQRLLREEPAASIQTIRRVEAFERGENRPQMGNRARIKAREPWPAPPVPR